MAFSPDGGNLAAGRGDGAIDVWDLAGQTIRRQISGNRAPVVSLGYSSDGKKLVSVAATGEIKVFDVSRTEPEGLTTVEGPQPGRAVISRDGRRAAISVWNHPDLKDGVTSYNLSATPAPQECFLPVIAYGMTFSRDGKRLALVGDKMVRIWSDETEQFVDAFDGDGIEFIDVDFSPDERLLAAAGIGAIAVWDLASGERLWLTHAPSDGSHFYDVAFAPDGRTLLVGEGGSRSQARLYDVAAGQELAVLPPERPFALILAGWIAAFALWAVAWVRSGLVERRVWCALCDLVLIEGLIFAGLIVRLAATGTNSGTVRLPVAASLGVLTALFSLLITWAMLGRSRWQWRAPGLIAGWALLWAVLIALARALDFGQAAVWNVSVGATAMLAMLLFLMHLVQAQGWRFVPAADENTVSALRPQPTRQFHLHDLLTWTFAAAVFFGTFRYVAPQEQPAVAIWFEVAIGAGLAVACATGVWVVFGRAPLIARLAALAVIPLLCGSLAELFRSFGVLEPWWWYAALDLVASLFVASTLAMFFLHGVRLRRSGSPPLPASSSTPALV